jgi:cytochrome c5
MMRMMGQRSMELPEGIPAADLPEPDSRGARLVARYCSQCHGIPSPRRHAPEDWEATARRMFRRMDHMQHMRGMGGMMGGGVHRGMRDVAAPSADEERAILAYLREHAMRGARAEALPAGEGRETFGRVCSRCHALPDPAQHTPEEWPAVVARMRENTERMEVEGITDAEAERIVRYLQGAASEGDP